MLASGNVLLGEKMSMHRAHAEAELRKQSDDARQRLLQAAADRELAARIDDPAARRAKLRELVKERANA